MRAKVPQAALVAASKQCERLLARSDVWLSSPVNMRPEFGPNYRGEMNAARRNERFIRASRALCRRPGRPQPACSSEIRHAPPDVRCWKTAGFEKRTIKCILLPLTWLRIWGGRRIGGRAARASRNPGWVHRHRHRNRHTVCQGQCLPRSPSSRLRAIDARAPVCLGRRWAGSAKSRRRPMPYWQFRRTV